MDNRQDNVAVWSRSESDTRIRELSHWLGYGRWKDVDRWRRLGAAAESVVLRHRRLAQLPKRSGRVLEWGVGGGAIATALRKDMSEYVGVDVSRENLEECARRLAADEFMSFRPFVIDTDPASIIAELRESVDILVSFAVFQHFPDKAYGQEVLRVAHEIMKPNAQGVIQIRYHNGNPRFEPKTGDYETNFVTFTSYTIDEFHGLLTAAGFHVDMMTDLKPEVNYVTFCFRRR